MNEITSLLDMKIKHMREFVDCLEIEIVTEGTQTLIIPVYNQFIESTTTTLQFKTLKQGSIDNYELLTWDNYNLHCGLESQLQRHPVVIESQKQYMIDELTRKIALKECTKTVMNLDTQAIMNLKLQHINDGYSPDYGVYIITKTGTKFFAVIDISTFKFYMKPLIYAKSSYTDSIEFKQQGALHVIDEGWSLCKYKNDTYIMEAMEHGKYVKS